MDLSFANQLFSGNWGLYALCGLVLIIGIIAFLNHMYPNEPHYRPK